MTKKITLFDYLQLTEAGEEITVTDKEYDIETYFYKHDSKNADSWDNSIKKLSQVLTVKKIYNHAIAVNLSEIIENRIEDLKKSDLFISCNIDDIMDDMGNILAGYVSEEWLEKFVNILVNNKELTK